MPDPALDHAIALGQAGRTQEAAAIFERLAQAGNADALFLLADLHWRGEPLPQNFIRGRQLFAAAALAGHAMARRATTNLMASGIAGPRDWQGALMRLRLEAQEDRLRGHMLWLIDQMALTPQGDPTALPRGEQLSETPWVVRYPAVLSRAECEYLTIISEPCFQPSMVIDGGRDVRDPIRTSDGSTMHWLIEDPAVHALNRRIAGITGTHTSQGESLHVLRYRVGQQYRRHFDWVGNENRRIQTALIYLNDAYDGGETEFNKVGLKVRGQPGDVLVFRNAGADGMLDKLTEHAGLPVTRGTKYLATRWIRERRDPAFFD
ncbi:2OG-Fe(II) oxygenase [Sphingomonas sp.]|uniref:2OG-Fe(II) oxygenase n=1 Tax=Sphingomonas sp. TaxID=28214 RepID=UPI001B1150BE|nr:2OG-Fe(II) oxygenase [Sphingomonas sp.]MBO9714821.1 2OG-Fe(II) oxygenase [Sphingomonas sp.]